MSGPEESLAEGWEKLRTDTSTTKGIEMDNPMPVGRYLGCEHVVEKRKSPISGKMVNSIVYDMSNFFRQAVQDYKTLAKTDHLRPVSTPFIPETVDDPRMIQQLSVAAARIMERGEKPSESSKAELYEEEDLFVVALVKLRVKHIF